MLSKYTVPGEEGEALLGTAVGMDAALNERVGAILGGGEVYQLSDGRILIFERVSFRDADGPTGFVIQESPDRERAYAKLFPTRQVLLEELAKIESGREVLMRSWQGEDAHH